MKNRIISLIKKTKSGKFLISDKTFRIFFMGSLNMGWNLIYAIINLILSMVYRSYWFLTMFAFHTTLGIMRLSVVSFVQNKNTKRKLHFVMKNNGLAIIFLSIVMVGIVTLTISQSVSKKYDTILMITIATFTFISVINSIGNTVKAHKKKKMTIIILRNISLTSAVGSVFSLEKSMLATFGNADDRFTYTMEGVSGLGAFLIIVAIGVSMIILSSKTIK